MTATCGARTKRCRECGHRYTKEEYDLWQCPECGTDRACRRPVAIEGQRCRFHGGRSLKGAAAPAFKTGRHSKYLPARLVERYETAIADRELLALRGEIALLDTRLSQLLGGLETGETAALWGELQEAYQEARAAYDAGEGKLLLAALDRIGDLVQVGGHEGDIWAEVYVLVEQRRRLTESERKRLVAMQQMLTAEQAMALLARIQQVIVDHVDDRHVLTSIAAEFNRIAAVESGKQS